MVQITKNSTLYNVQNVTKSAAKVTGTISVMDGGRISEMHLNFSKDNTQIGSVNYAEYEGSICCNYNYSDVSMREEIEQATNEVINEVKQPK